MTRAGEEEPDMKKNTVKRTKKTVRPLPYPGAAEPRYFLNKFVDGCLAVATGAGACTILFFLTVL